MISARELIVIDENGENLGKLAREEALDLAASKELDLIEVAPKAVPPVAKITSYSKFKYQQEKKKKNNKNKAIKQKEMWFRVFIGEGDFQHKIQRIIEFLNKKHSVKISIKTKGRVTKEQTQELLNRIITSLGDHIAEITETPKFEGRNLSLLIHPNKKKKHEDENKNTQSN